MRAQATLLRVLDRFDAHVAPVLPKLRRSVIHNDASDWNVLVASAADPLVVGLIDVGDAMHTITVAELAIACAYACMRSADPIRAASVIARAYHRELLLEEAEVAVLYDLVAARLAISASMAASRRGPAAQANPYLLASERAVWQLLRRWLAVEPDEATRLFREVLEDSLPELIERCE